MDEPCEIGEGSEDLAFLPRPIWSPDRQRCVFGQNCNVANDVVIGNNVKVQNNVSIYTGTIIEDDVFLGPSCVLTNVSNPRSHVNRHGLRENPASPRVHDRRQRDGRVRDNGGALRVRGRRRGCRQGCLRLRADGRGARKAGRMDEPAWPSPGKGGVGEPIVCPESGFRYREVAPILSGAWIWTKMRRCRRCSPSVRSPTTRGSSND